MRPPVTVHVLVVGSPAPGPAGTARCMERLGPTLRADDRLVLLVPDGTSAGPVPARAQVLAGAPGEDLPALAARARDRAATTVVAELHSDVVVTPHWLDRLVAAVEQPGVRVAGATSNAAPPGQSVLGAEYDDGRTSLRDYARLRGCSAPAPERVRAEPADLCRVVRRDLAPAAGDGVVVHAVFVHHAVEAGCPDRACDALDPGAPLLSASLIVKDEEEDILGCLAALAPFVDEVVVYDTGSTDRTRELAAGTGATVVQGYWDDDFGAARNRSLAHCTGRWVMVVDADERAEGDPAELRARLAASTDESHMVTIHNTSSGGVGSIQTHLAMRLFRRAPATWVGRLHEQVTHRRRGHRLFGPTAGALSLRHSGYLPERFAGRDKAARNLALAQAALADARRSGLDVGAAAGNLARAHYSAGQHEQALAVFEQAWDGTITRALRMTCSAAITCALRLRRPGPAWTWLARLEEAGECAFAVAAHRALVLDGLGEHAQALQVLEQLPETATDADGVVHRRSSTAALRADLLTRLGRPDEAVDVHLATLAAGVSDTHLVQHLALLRAAGRPPAHLAAALPPDLRVPFLAQCLQVDPRDGHALLDALWLLEPRADVLATASRLAPAMPVPLALEWSARLRGSGLHELCPLVALAAGHARTPRDRAVAAAVAHATFGDARALGLLDRALDAVDAADEAGVLAELAVLAPGLVEPAGV